MGVKRTVAARAARLHAIALGVLFLPAALGVKRGASSVLLDISGRKVLGQKPGPNDVRAPAPGVYFVRQASGVGREASSVHKIASRASVV